VIDAPPLPYEQIIEQRLVQCGLKIEGLSVRYEDYLQSFEIVIRTTSGATTDHFECIKNAAGYEIVTFEDRDMYQAYGDYTSELARPQLLKSLKARLQERGLLEAFPERRDFESLETYARALEAHGGIEPGRALHVAGDGILFDPPRDENNPMAMFERYSDLMAIATYASMRDGWKLAFVGNGAVAE
jgi:hypothetical protein